MIRRPPRSTLDRSSAASDVYKRQAFIRNEVSKYEWLDIGSSFGLSEFQAAVLYAQLECLDALLAHRLNSWKWYMDCLLYTSPSPRDRTRSRMPSSA